MIENRNLRTLWVVPLVGFLVLAALPAYAERPVGEAPVARMSIHGASASFAPMVSFEEMTLTVAGRGHVSMQTVRGGQTASFVPVDEEGYALPDGTYKWEIVVSPDLRDLRPSDFSNGKVSADGRTAVAPEAPSRQRQSGVFTVKNGMMVDPNLVEADAGRGAPTMAPRATAPPTAAARSAEHAHRNDG